MKYLFTIILACVCITPASSQDANAEYINILLDTSGSMAETMRGSRVSKMEAAHNALTSVLDKVSPSTHVGVLTFEGWLFHAGEVNIPTAKTKINATRAGGGTPLGRYIKQAADDLLALRVKNKGYGRYRLIVVTDGEADDQDILDKYVRDITSRGIILDTIGVDMAENHSMGLRSRKYMNANNPQSFKNAVNEVVSEVGKASDDQLQDNVFDIIKPLPEALCKSIAAISYDNQPVGEAKKQPNLGQTVFNQVVANNQTLPSTGVSWTVIILGIFGGIGLAVLVIFVIGSLAQD